MRSTETIGPHTLEVTLAKNNKKKAVKALIRPFVNQYLRFPPVTDEDRLAMGIPNHDTKPTPVSAPASQVEADLVFPGIHLVELVKIRKVGSISNDPCSDYGVSIHYGILDAVNGASPLCQPPEMIFRTRCLPVRRRCSSTVMRNRARPSTSTCATKTRRTTKQG
jgi:hypothetical protein